MQIVTRSFRARDLPAEHRGRDPAAARSRPHRLVDLLGFIPLIGWIILLIWYFTRGTDGPNRFGPDPLATLAIRASPRAA